MCVCVCVCACVYRPQDFHPDPILFIWDQNAGQQQSEGLGTGARQAAPRRWLPSCEEHHSAGAYNHNPGWSTEVFG